MSTIKERFDKLVEKRENLKTQIVQLETKIDSARESMEAIEKEWKEQFGISSYEEAKEKLDSMERDIDATLTKCETYLEKVGV